MTLIEELVKTFHLQEYKEEELLSFLKEKNVEEIEIKQIGKYRRIFFKEEGKNKTLFVKVDKRNIVISLSLEFGKEYNAPNDLMLTGCLIALIIPIGLVLWFGFYIVTTIMEPSEPDTSNNPYTEDFDGDGIGGTKEDHDIYHKIYK